MLALTSDATPQMRQRCLQAGAYAVSDKATEINTFLSDALDEVARVAGQTFW